VNSQWALKTASINEPVTLGRVEVNPGDIIFADETGILIIPEARKAMVLAKANEIRKLEEITRANVS
jgi:3-hexulose-6-phosphate synthase/6-phospho-3-hexuloisomerase